MEEIFSTIRPANETLRLLVLHSSEDSLGLDIANGIVARLNGVVVSDVQRFEHYGELVDQLERVKAESFHAVLFVVHGNKLSHKMRPANDRDNAGEVLRTSFAELLPSFKHYLRDCLVLFGVCHFGAGELCAALKGNVAAVAAVAPNTTISNREIVLHYGNVLLELAKDKADIRAEQVSAACNRLPSDFRSHIVVYAEDGSGDCP